MGGCRSGDDVGRGGMAGYVGGVAPGLGHRDETRRVTAGCSIGPGGLSLCVRGDMVHYARRQQQRPMDKPCIRLYGDIFILFFYNRKTGRYSFFFSTDRKFGEGVGYVGG